MPFNDGTGPQGRGPGTGRGLGRCFRRPGTGKKIGGAGIGATLMTYVVQDVFRSNSLIRSGIRKALSRFTSRRAALPGPSQLNREKIVDAEYREITDEKEG